MLSGVPAHAQQAVVVGAGDGFAAPGRVVHIKRFRPGAVDPNATADIQCQLPRLSYFGGPVISNVKVATVFWNSSVNSALQGHMNQFFEDIATTPYYDMLSEYSTDIATVGGTRGTQQSVGRGRALGNFTLVPAKCPASGGAATCTLDDVDLQIEILNQIEAGHLPAPELDLNGNPDTMYMVFFPPNIKLTQGGQTGCVDFCAYHGTSRFKSKPLIYGAVMDEFAGACSAGCGTAAPLDNTASTAAHELAEAVTDADIGLVTGSNYAAPAGWADSDNSCGEIGDICDSGKQYPVTVSGRTWMVQSLWSNSQNNCVMSGLHPNLVLDIPTKTTAGNPLSFTLDVLNPAGGKTADTAFADTVHFTSSDTTATLPSDFTFTQADKGTAIFKATFGVNGSPTITVTDTGNSAVTATARVDVGNVIAATVGTSPEGMAFTVDGKSYAGTQLFSWVIGSTHTLATAATQAPSTGVKETFIAWSDGRAVSHTLTAPSADTSYTAKFAATYLLTTAASPANEGTVTPASGSYSTPGKVVALKATAGQQYVFKSWTGPVASASSASTTVTMQGPETVTASFVSVILPITIGTSPQGLQVLVDHAPAQTAPVTVNWLVGTQHSISVSSPQNTATVRHTFQKWSDGGVFSHFVTAAVGTPSYTAFFDTQYPLTTAVSPAGSGSVSPLSGKFYVSGTPVRLSAVAKIPYVFSKWTGNVDNPALPSPLTTVNAPETVTANFVEVGSRPVTVTLQSSSNPVAYNDPLAFTANVVTTDKGNVAGYVTFQANSKSIGVAQVVGGSATLQNVQLSGGVNSIVAVYSGDANYRSWPSAALKQTVTRLDPVLLVSSLPNPAPAGTSVTISVLVLPPGTSPTGKLSFSLGGTLLGSVAFTPANPGKVSFSTTALPKGKDTVTVAYTGDINFNSSTAQTTVTIQ